MNSHFRNLTISTLSVAMAMSIGCDGDRGEATATPPVAPSTPSAPASEAPVAPVAATPAPAAAPPIPVTLEALRATMDKDGDGAVTPEEHASEANTMFASMDTDGDGNVTAVEMDASEQALGAKKRALAADRIKALDSGGDGMLSTDEHVANARGMFDTMDTDRNGDLSMAEMQAGQDRILAASKQ